MSEDTIEQIEVDLGGGVKAMLSKEDGQKFIANRDLKVKAFNEKEAQLQAKSDAEASAAAKAKQDQEERIAMEAAKNGELDLLKNHHAAEKAKLAQDNLSLSLQSALASRQDLVASAVPDVSAMLAMSGDIVRENGKTLHKAADGTTQSIDAYLDSWLEARPHYKTSTMPPKQSGDGDKKIPVDVDTITRAEYDKQPSKYLQALAARKLIVKDQLNG